VAESPVVLPAVSNGWKPRMASLLFTCPTTRRQAPSGIETDAQSLRAAWSKKLKVQCSLCGETHEISVRETYIEGALHDAVDRMRGNV
jgi:hypothetical protein